MPNQPELIGTGDAATRLSEQDVRAIVRQAADAIAPDNQRVLVIVPDQTRSCPLKLIARELHAALAGRVATLDFLIALGTHPACSEQQIDELLGRENLPGCGVFNHEWDNPEAMATVGTLTADKVNEITEGRFSMDVDVTVNKRIFDYDVVMVAGPVFPHEVVGFSGGEKYFFPGICGPELLNFFHWLGAVITCPRIIGTKVTPVRRTLWAAGDMLEAAGVVPCGLKMVVTGHDDLRGLYFGPLREAWSAAADLSAKVHVTYVDAPYQSVLSCAPEMYDEIWVAAKCMYKLEPVVADGGELIIYAPHVEELSVVHGKLIEELGYHTLEYFLKQWDTFKGYPWGVIAHSTHVRGVGSYDADSGIEQPRINVTLATAISEATCRKINLDYRDPATIDPSQWQGRDDRLHVPRAGEMLYKLKAPPAWQTFDQ